MKNAVLTVSLALLTVGCVGLAQAEVQKDAELESKFNFYNLETSVNQDSFNLLDIESDNQKFEAVKPIKAPINKIKHNCVANRTHVNCL